MDAEDDVTLSGAEFKLYFGDELIGTYTTDDQGIINFTNLVKGEYTVVETKAPEGYQLNTKPINFNVGDTNELFELVVTNTKEDKISVTVSKVWNDFEDKFNLRPDSINVRLYANGNSTSLVKNLNSNNNWQASFDNLNTGVTYTFKEEYDDINYDNSINGDVITNTLITGKFEINKQNLAGEGLSGAKFRITYDYNLNNELDDEDLLIGEYVSDEQGNIIIEDLAYGTYFYQELEAPEGYQLDNTIKEFELSANNQSVEVVNEIIDTELQSFYVRKEWNDNDDLYNLRADSVQIQLYLGEQAVGAPITLDVSNNWEYLYTDLPIGEYRVEEIDVEENYAVTYNPLVNGVEVENTLTLIDPNFVKVDAEDEAIKLSGATFSLYIDSDNDGKINYATDQKIGEYTTNELGIAHTPDLPYATYFYQEIKAPAGYELDDTVRSFVIDEDSPEVVSIKVINRKIIDAVEPDVDKDEGVEEEKNPPTGDKTNIHFYIMLALVAFMGIIRFSRLDKRS